MSLIHYGFSREEVYWMPIEELNDYITLLNQQVEKEKGTEVSSQKEAPKTFADVFGLMGNPLKKK